MKRVRWECPNGCAAVLGPSRPRKNDVCRYCLACSAVRGRLVERAAPSLDKKRAARADKAKAEQLAIRRAAVAREAAYYTIAGIDIREEAKLLLRTDALRGMSMPRFVVRRASSHPRARLGFCRYWAGLIQITAYPGIDPHDVRETLAHELAHMRAKVRGTALRRDHHGTHFRTVFRLVCEEAYGVRPRLEYRWHGEVSRLLREKESMKLNQWVAAESTKENA